MGVPIRDARRTNFVATAILTTTTPERIEKLAVLFARELAQRREIDRFREQSEAYLMQISDDLEELALLRSFSEHLELSDVTTDLSSMAQAVLPQLCQSVKAEGLVLILNSETDDTTGEPRSPTERRIVWGGATEVEDATCFRVVERFRDQARERPVVRNDVLLGDIALDFPGVQEFILVPIAKADRVMGWLLALNRIVRRGVNGESLRWNAYQSEFGTIEASLMKSVASMLAAQARNVEQFREKEQLLVDMVRSLVSAIDAKDPYTCGHSERVALYSQCLGRALGLSLVDTERLYLAALVHDVGKIGVSDATLGKQGPLTDEEFAEIQKHPELGWDILQELTQLQYVLPGVVFHHERFDGKGYPDGLAGGDIPLDGRIIAVADSYDAMTSDRPYRKGMPCEKSRGHYSRRGRHAVGRRGRRQVPANHARDLSDPGRLPDSPAQTAASRHDHRPPRVTTPKFLGFLGFLP